MDREGINETLKNHKCLTCENLSYWDGYFCKEGKHCNKDDKLSMKPLKNCDNYIKRVGSNWGSCKDQECMFWCTECPAYKNR